MSTTLPDSSLSPDWQPLVAPRAWFMFPTTPCCPTGITGCSACAAAPAQWRMVVSGITNASCGNCNRWNGTIILTNHTLIPLSGGPCFWSSPVEPGFAPCSAGCANCSRWTLVLAAVEAELLIDGLSMGVYTLPLTSFDCLGTNTLTLGRGSSDCANWPATITIEPV